MALGLRRAHGRPAENLVVGLLAEQIKQPLGRHSVYKCAYVPFCIRVRQWVQQVGDGVRAIEGGVPIPAIRA